MRRTITTIILILLPLTLLSQSGELRGVLVDSAGSSPVGYGTVRALNAQDSSVLGGAVADSLGHFTIDKLPMGQVLVMVEAMGYEPLTRLVEVRKRGEDMGQIALVASAELIEEVRVTGKAPEVILKAGRKEIHLPEADVKMGVPLTELLSRTPDFGIDEKGNLILNGGTFAIYIDGRPSSYGAQDLDAIPANRIERVEVVTNPAADQRAALRGGYINIIRKKRTQPGFNGVIQGLGGFNSYFWGNATFNLDLKRVNIFASFYGLYDGVRRPLSNETRDEATGAKIHSHRTDTRLKGFAYQPRIGVEAMPTDMSIVGLFYHFKQEPLRYEGNAVDSTAPFAPTNIWRASMNHSMRNSTHSVRAVYGQMFPSTQTGLETYANFYHTQAMDSVLNDGEGMLQALRFVSRTPSSYGISCDVKVTQALLSQRLMLQTGVAFNHDALRVQQQVWDSPPLVSHWVQRLDFSGSMQEQTYGIFADAYFTVSSQLSLNGGLRYEYNVRRIRSDVAYDPREGLPFGSFGLSYYPLQWLSMSVSYSGRIQRPEVDSYLQPYAPSDHINEYWKPNPNLRSAYEHRGQLALQQRFGEILQISEDVHYSYTVDPFYRTTRWEGGSRWYRSYENAGNEHNVRARLNVSSQPAEWVRLGLQGQVRWVSITEPGAAQNAPLAFSWNASGDVTFYILSKLRIIVAGGYYGETRSYTRTSLPQVVLYTRLYYTPIPSLSLAFTADNLLNIPSEYYYTTQMGQRTVWAYNWFPRSYYLSILWRFGKEFRARSGVDLNTEQRVDYNN